MGIHYKEEQSVYLAGLHSVGLSGLVMLPVQRRPLKPVWMVMRNNESSCDGLSPMCFQIECSWSAIRRCLQFIGLLNQHLHPLRVYAMRALLQLSYISR